MSLREVAKSLADTKHQNQPSLDLDFEKQKPPSTKQEEPRSSDRVNDFLHEWIDRYINQQLGIKQ